MEILRGHFKKEESTEEKTESILRNSKKLKELSYRMAEIKNDYYSWSQYIEVCEIEDIRDAQERLNKCTN